ncbi:MAG: helix-turn-helix domain-containing protein [Candidatus Falkowbacteria bacterium]
MQLSILKKLGLTEREILVYIKLLEQGALSVRSLAALTELNRGTAYDTLKHLQELGLVSFYHQDSKQKFVAEVPEKLNELVLEQERGLVQVKFQLAEIIPELKSLAGKEATQPVTRFYEGRAGIKTILNDVLLTMSKTNDKAYFVYSALGVREDIYQAYPEFNQKRVKSGIMAKTISLAQGGGTYGLDERRWLPMSEKADAHLTYIIIYAGKSAFISRDQAGNPVCVLVENQMIAETQKTIFNSLWQTLS